MGRNENRAWQWEEEIRHAQFFEGVKCSSLWGPRRHLLHASHPKGKKVEKQILFITGLDCQQKIF
jgi:hypothetical protein